MANWDVLQEEIDQRELGLEIRFALKKGTDAIMNTVGEVENLAQSATFNTLPADIKQVLLRWHSMFKDTRDTMTADQEVKDTYLWVP